MERFKWLIWVAGGVAWIAVVAAVVTISLDGAEGAAADGVIRDPNGAQVIVAYISSGVFAIPGIAFVIAGLRRRFRG
jgi:hypothetical protein